MKRPQTKKSYLFVYGSSVVLSLVLIIFSIYFTSTPQETTAHSTATHANCHYYLEDGASDPDCSESALSNYFKEYTWAAREIASAESRCNPQAEGDNPPGGGAIPRTSYDVGLFQINEYWHCGQTHTCSTTGESVTLSGTPGASTPSSACRQELKDPKTNKIVACALSNGGTNWQPWATAQSGYCNLVNPEPGDTPPPGDDDGGGGGSGGGSGGGGSGGGSGTSTVCSKGPVKLGPVNCGVDFPAIPTPNGPVDLNDLCKAGAEITIGALIAYTYYASLWASGVIAFISLVYAGLMYMLSGANAGNREKARERLRAVIIGVLILFLTVITVNLINPDIAKLQLTGLADVQRGSANCIEGPGSGSGAPVDCSGSTYSCQVSFGGNQCITASECASGCKPTDYVCSEFNAAGNSSGMQQCSVITQEMGASACEPITPPGEYYCSWTDAGLCVTSENFCAAGYGEDENNRCEDKTTASECLGSLINSCVSTAIGNSGCEPDTGPKQILCSSGSECQPWCTDPQYTSLKTDPAYSENWPAIMGTSCTQDINSLGLTGWANSSGQTNSNISKNTAFLDAVRKAGEKANSMGYQLFLTSGHRPLFDQVRVLCYGGGRSGGAGEMDAVIGSLVARPGGSNHGIGVAVDLALYKGGARLSKTSTTCSILAQIMYDSDPGWYRYTTEDWHFEFWPNGSPFSNRSRSAFNCT